MVSGESSSQSTSTSGESEPPELESPEVYPFPHNVPWRRPIIPSKYPNKCLVCSGTIRVGDSITPLHRNSKRWIHELCYEED
jgi:hypothetical protein